jgi:hypothetical protein
MPTTTTCPLPRLSERADSWVPALLQGESPGAGHGGGTLIPDSSPDLPIKLHCPREEDVWFVISDHGDMTLVPFMSYLNLSPPCPSILAHYSCNNFCLHESSFI